MANVFEKATKFAATGLALLRSEVKAPGLFVHKFGISDFKGAADDTVMVKRPPLLAARDKGFRTSNAIVVDDLVQSKISVVLDKFPYSAVHLSPEEATLDEVEYVRDIQAPQINSVLGFYEDVIVSTLGGADFVYEVNFTPNSTPTTYNHDPATVALRARRHFQDAKVPTGGRYWIVGSTVSESIAGNDRLLGVDTSGLPEALRDGVVGKLAGFIVVELDALDPEESYFVHETAVALANVAPVVPKGAVSGSSINGNGMSITQIFDYDSVNAKDRSIVESFVGASLVLDPEVGADGKIVLDNDVPRMEFFRAVKVNYGSSSKKASWTLAVTAATGGSFTLTVDGEETADIAYNAANADIAAALNALVGVVGVKVTGTASKTVKFVSEVLVTADGAKLTGAGGEAVAVS